MQIATRECFFTRTLDPTKAKKRYRALSLILHPDVETGDTTLMQRLNQEFDAYQAGTLAPAQVDPPPPKRDPYDDIPPRYSGLDHLVERAGARVISELPMFLRGQIVFQISVESRRVLATGANTYQYKEDLKERGFKWDKADKVWFFEVFL